MSQNILPQTILFQDDEKSMNYRYKLDYTLNKDISVKSIEYDLEELKNSGFELYGPRPDNDSIYYLHPYKDNVYVHESLAENFLINEKVDLFKKVAADLGATSISTKVSFLETKKIVVDINGKVQVKVFKGGIDSHSDKVQSLKSSIERTYKIEKSDNFDLNANIDKWSKYICHHNLKHETDLVALIEDRDPRISGRYITESTVKSEMTAEYSNLLKVSAQLSSPIFNVSSDFQRSLETVNSVNVEIIFKFN
ncbi:hypothetical protein [Flavobacterium ardleyense]|uniref:hypothetical protein n=1 Tax=Flavobacterium ardleyense TaxID=2038737 RepID=UPI00298D4A8C|nr:hypothetical protein [Flavobacterium ardleyense]